MAETAATPSTVVDGIDNMHGGADDDTYIVTAYDQVDEQMGGGTQDRVRALDSYALAKGSEVEVLETTDAAGSAAINLNGNEFDNTIIGNAGKNILFGDMGRDDMTGNGGNDDFYWYSTAETGLTASDADVVTDFVFGSDILLVSPIDANVTNG